MSLDEFTSYINNISDNDFPKGDIPIIFNICIRSQVNEVDSARHYRMIFPEWIEGICRVIDKVSPAPPNEDQVSYNSLFNYLYL